MAGANSASKMEEEEEEEEEEGEEAANLLPNKIGTKVKTSFPGRRKDATK